MDILDAKVLHFVFILVMYVTGITIVQMVVMKKIVVGNKC